MMTQKLPKRGRRPRKKDGLKNHLEVVSTLHLASLISVVASTSLWPAAAGPQVPAAATPEQSPAPTDTPNGNTMV
eukprot:13954374-Ditylum_brightwellii.AAC.1